MQNKTAFVEKYLLDRINSGEFVPGSKIPSQHQLTTRCKCSRITVQRAIQLMIRDGYLYTGKGSGTFVRPGPYCVPLREIIVICDDSNCYHKSSEKIVPADILPVKWISSEFAIRHFETFFMPGQVIIWHTAREGHVMLMQYLKSRNIPQLLINRTFENLNYITLDAVSSLCEGLHWLQHKAGNRIAFVSYQLAPRLPYLAERIIAFYEACIITGAQLPPEYIFKDDFSDVKTTFARLGEQIFAPADRPRGICVLHATLVEPTVEAAAKYGLEMGRDYYILAFDLVPSLENHPGLGMMIQPLARFREEVTKYLNGVINNSSDVFQIRLKMDLQNT